MQKLAYDRNTVMHLEGNLGRCQTRRKQTNFDLTWQEAFGNTGGRVSSRRIEMYISLDSTSAHRSHISKSSVDEHTL